VTKKRIHLMGASGSGTTTLGRALAQRLGCPHFDTDHYFWFPTAPPFEKIRPVEDPNPSPAVATGRSP